MLTKGLLLVGLRLSHEDPFSVDAEQTSRAAEAAEMMLQQMLLVDLVAEVDLPSPPRPLTQTLQGQEGGFNFWPHQAAQVVVLLVVDLEVHLQRSCHHQWECLGIGQQMPHQAPENVVNWTRIFTSAVFQKERHHRCCPSLHEDPACQSDDDWPCRGPAFSTTRRWRRAWRASSEDAIRPSLSKRRLTCWRPALIRIVPCASQWHATCPESGSRWTAITAAGPRHRMVWNFCWTRANRDTVRQAKDPLPSHETA